MATDHEVETLLTIPPLQAKQGKRIRVKKHLAQIRVMFLLSNVKIVNDTSPRLQATHLVPLQTKIEEGERRNENPPKGGKENLAT